MNSNLSRRVRNNIFCDEDVPYFSSKFLKKLSGVNRLAVCVMLLMDSFFSAAEKNVI